MFLSGTNVPKGGDAMKLDIFKLNVILAERGMSKADLAKICGISRQNISTLWTRGTCWPQTAGKLATALGVDVTEIVRESNIA